MLQSRQYRTELIGRLDRWLDSASGSNARMTAEIGLPACRAVVAFGEERHADVIAELFPIRRILAHVRTLPARYDAGIGASSGARAGYMYLFGPMEARARAAGP